MMYSNPYNSRKTGSNGSSLARRIVIGVFLLASLVITILLYFFAFPSWLVRLSGVQTTAIAHASGTCSDDDDSGDTYTFIYAFTDLQGKQYQIVRDNFCTNIISSGDRVTIWYMPDDPTNLLTAPEAILLYIFSGIGGAADLTCLVLLFLALRSGWRARRRQDMFSYSG